MKINVQANASFKEVDHSKKRYIVMKGSAGSGKSMDTAQHYILRLMNDPGRNLLCVRKADVTNRDSTFAELQGAIFRMFGESYKRYWYINSSNMLLECKSNYNQIIFRGVNDEKQREKLKSITFKRGKLTDVWIEEATEITQSDFEIIDDRLRGELPEGQFYQIRMTFNPVSAHHWIKKVFFDRTDPDVLTHQSTYENNRFIDEAYHRRMLRRKEVDPEGYRVYGLGEWGEVAGLILKNYVIEEFDRNPENYDYIVNAQDFGFNHANCIGEVGFKDGDLYLFQELYIYEMDTEEIIKTVVNIAPAFGGINLEDISAPRCFEIESRLKELLDIPVFHDDQHGTAIVVLAGIINALKVTGKKKEDCKIVVNGAGSAGVAITKLLLTYGFPKITMCDINGIISADSPNLNWMQKEMTKVTNLDHETGTLADALKGADIFVGVSAPNIVSQEMVASMNKDAILFAMANPVPEIMPDLAKAAGAKVVGTGRSDFPNQVNNVVAFPGIFKGALEGRASQITEEMKLATAKAIAGLVPDEELNEDNILPEAFDPRVSQVVSEAVKALI